MVTEAKDEEADTTQSDTLTLILAVLMIVMLSVVMFLLCVIRNQKRRRAADQVVQNRQKSKLDLSEASESDRARTPKKPAGSAYSDVNRAD